MSRSDDIAGRGTQRSGEANFAFARRAMVSDLMTWHYENPARLKEHLRHDREFMAWMAAGGLNAFCFIRHTRDTLLRIDQLAPILAAQGIDAEYGGHVIQLLLPRACYANHPEYFPADQRGSRLQTGNLCVSNPEALAMVRDNALGYVRDYPENRLLHVWGADVWAGGWCRCGGCARLTPQMQYMTVVNEIARALEQTSASPPVAYLAYHDTLEPDAALRPRENVWFEWAPRERCYAHSIDQPECARNRRYFEWLRRYVDLFDGRGMVFEYYADAILFGGLGFATPAVILRDLRAYHALGIRSISCLTFGAYSVFAYPTNLETFARATRTLDFEPGPALTETAAMRHPQRGADAAAAYRAIERASALVLTYGDVMRPFLPLEDACAKRAEIERARACLDDAVAAAGAIASGGGNPLAAAERELWRYSRDTLAGIGDYLAARIASGAQRRAAGKAAIGKIAGALAHLRAVAPAFKGTWGSYDLERFHRRWLEGLRARLDDEKQKERPDEQAP